jgi:hypothetical protein
MGGVPGPKWSLFHSGCLNRQLNQRAILRDAGFFAYLTCSSEVAATDDGAGWSQAMTGQVSQRQERAIGRMFVGRSGGVGGRLGEMMAESEGSS